MAIQTSEPDPTAAEPSLASKDTLEQDVNDDSDAGSFLDDDTEDFLPSSWVGSDEKKTVSGYKPRKRGAMKVKIEVAKQPSKALAVARRPNSKQEPQTTPSPSPSESELLSLAITGTNSTLVTSTTPQTSISSTTSTTMSQHSTVTIGRLQVQASLIRQPRSPLDLMQERIRNLKRDIERKDKEIKHVNQRVRDQQLASMKAEEQAKEIQRALEEKITSLEDKLGGSVPMIELKFERDAIEGQRQKATADLMKLREKHEKVVKRFSATGKKLSSANEDLAKAHMEINQLEVETGQKDLQIEHLSREAVSFRISHQRSQDALRQEQAAAIEMRQKFNDMSAQVSTLSEQLAVARTLANRSSAPPRVSAETQNTTQKYRSLQGNHDKLKRDYSNALREIQEVKEDKNSYLRDLAQVRREKDIAQGRVRRLEGDNMRLVSANLRLRGEVEELEDKIELLEPIVQIGVDVRLRNLEWGRETALGVSTSDIDRAVIRRGNIAAHRANGTVDAALFKAELVPEDLIEEAERVFEKMYEVPPSGIDEWLPKALRFTECQATIRTYKAVRKSATYLARRAEYDRLEASLIIDYRSMACSYFEIDPDVDHKLLSLEEVTEEIVDLGRGRGNRRKRSRFNENYSVDYESDDE